MITFPSEAIAGGSAFGTQPALALQDRGGNALAWASIAESTYEVEADIAPSLGADWVGVVSTAGDTPPGVIDVNVRPGAGTKPDGSGRSRKCGQSSDARGRRRHRRRAHV